MKHTVLTLPSVGIPILTLALLAPTAAGAPQEQGNPMAEQGIGIQRADAVPFMSVSLGDLAHWVQHPKDAGLARAFGMLEARLAELPNELGDELPPEILPAFAPESIPTWLHFLRAPKTFTVGVSQIQQEATGEPFVVGFGVRSENEEAAEKYEADIYAMLQRMNAPVPPGIFQREGDSLVFRMGVDPMPIGATKAAALLGDGPLMQEMTIDVGSALGFFREMIAQEGGMPEGMDTMIFSMFEHMGLNDLTVEVASRADGAHSKTASVATGMGRKMRDAGILPVDGLTTAHLLPIPADATFATVERLNMLAAFDALNDLISEVMVQQGQGEFDLAEAAQFTGLDLRDGLFGALGDTLGTYSSDTTGGGGISSTVLFASIKDLDALIDTKETVQGLMEQFLAGEVNGYVAARTWMQGENEYTTLMFPGLPIPFEPTIAMSDSWLIMGFTPQAALGAMQHINGGGASLATNADVAALLNGEAKTAISYVDTAHYARTGYGPTSMMMSAVSNGVRSPMDGAREPGPIVPVYSEFKNGIAPTVGYTTVMGDDLVTMSTTDGSTVVQFAAMFGIVQEFLPLIMLPLAALGVQEMDRSGGF